MTKSTFLIYSTEQAEEGLDVSDEEKPIIIGIYKGKKFSYVAKLDPGYLKKMLIEKGVNKQTKETVEHHCKEEFGKADK